MTILTAVLLLKRRFLKIAKPPVLRTGGNNKSKSLGRYGNDLNFYMAFLDSKLYAVANGFSFRNATNFCTKCNNP